MAPFQVMQAIKEYIHLFPTGDSKLKLLIAVTDGKYAILSSLLANNS
jgi:hypothetical protein